MEPKPPTIASRINITITMTVELSPFVEPPNAADTLTNVVVELVAVVVVTVVVEVLVTVSVVVDTVAVMVVVVVVETEVVVVVVDVVHFPHVDGHISDNSSSRT